MTGVTCAYILAQKGWDVILIEKERELGGCCGAFLQGGNFLDKHAQYILEDDTEVLDLLDELSLRPELLWSEPKKGFFYKGFTNPFDSTGNSMTIRGLGLVDRLRMPLCLSRIRGTSDWKSFEDLTAEYWLRTWGGGSLFRNIWTPLLRNSFKDSYNQVSSVFLWQKYKKMAKKTAYLRGSFQRLTEVMAQEISAKNGSIRTSNTVKRIVARSEGGVRITTDKTIINCDVALVTTPLPVFMNMARKLPVEYNMSLNSIKYMNKLSMVLELDKPFSDFHSIEICDPSFPFGEIVEHTKYISSEYYNSHVIYINNYVEPQSVYLNYSPLKLLEDYLPYLKRINPDFTDSSINNSNLFKVSYACPVIKTDYSRRVPDIKTPLEGVFMATEAQIYPEEIDISSRIKLAGQAIDIISGSGESNT